MQNETTPSGPLYFQAAVTGIKDTTPHLRCITIRHDSLKAVGPLTPGVHLKLMLPREGRLPAPLPQRVNGRPFWPDEQHKPYLRTYTIRRRDPEAGTLDIEFVLHGDEGPASAWAGQAAIGDLLSIGMKTGNRIVTADWYLFAGDETALPAIAAKIEALPATAAGTAFLEVNGREDCFALEAPPGFTIRWLFREGVPPEASGLLLQHFKALDLPAAGQNLYLWVAGEAGVVRQIRNYAKETWALPQGALHVSAYWAKGLREDEMIRE